MKKRVLVLMSGGVDSSVAACLLKKQGYEVIGITLKVWPTERCGVEGRRSCCSLKGVEDARRAASQLDIPFYVLDYVTEFESDVISSFLNDYAAARTPNPCALCNDKIKFGRIFADADKFSAGHIATGHYARIEESGSGFLLKEAKDLSKDQSYFLFGINRAFLGRIIFPLGGYPKDEVREIAKRAGLSVHDKADSQEICFIPDDDLKGFISKNRPGALKKGPVFDEGGRLIGEHGGIAFYTIGQRKGLGIATSAPRYVTRIDGEANAIYLGREDKLMSSSLLAERPNWISIDGISGELDCLARIRYGAPKTKCRMYPVEGGGIKVEFASPQRAVTPGQAVVFYDGDIVIGGAWIR